MLEQKGISKCGKSKFIQKTQIIEAILTENKAGDITIFNLKTHHEAIGPPKVGTGIKADSQIKETG